MLLNKVMLLLELVFVNGFDKPDLKSVVCVLADYTDEVTDENNVSSYYYHVPFKIIIMVSSKYSTYKL